MRAPVTTLWIFALSQLLSAQQVSAQSKVDSLKTLLETSAGLDRAAQQYELAKLLVYTDIESAKHFFENSLATCQEVNNDTTMFKYLVWYQAWLSDVGEQELARHYLVMARDMNTPDTQAPRFRSMVYRAFFDINYWYLADFDSCVYYSQKLVEVSSDSAKRATAYILLAAAYNEQGDNLHALENYNVAQTFLQSPNADPFALAHLYNNMGMLYSDERELKTSEEYYLRAVQYAQASNRPAADLPALTNLGILYNWLGQYDKSLEYLDLAAERLPLYKDAWAVANNHVEIGNTLIAAGRLKEGIERSLTALRLFGELNDEFATASARLQLARGYRLMGNYQLAEREALGALNWDDKKKYGEHEKESYLELSKLYAAMRKYDKAFDYQSKYLTILDSLNSADRKTQFGLLEKNYLIAQQEKVRERLERENELHLAQASVDRTTRLSLMAGTAVLFVAMVAASIAYRRSRTQKLKIEEQAEQLKEAARTKARFFANVSHELRTPVTLLHGMLELMQENRDAASKKMDIALGSSRRLQSMLNEVLDLSRVEGGKWELSRKKREIAPLLNRIVLAFESLMVKKNLKLEYTASALDGLVMAIDEDKFEKIINNLMYNAVKFNHDGGWIRVTADVNDDSFIVQVADSGIGIPERELPFIFDRFYQSTSTDKLNSQGIGIGLSLVKEFAVLHGGDVRVTSRLNEGSCFTVRLPIISQEAAETDEVDDVLSIDVSFDKFSGKPEVLIVEDNDEMRYYLKEILGEHVSISEARHGREGLKWLRSNRPDLIISDVMMPEMDGYEFLGQLKNSPTYKGIPVVMLTARAAEEDLLQGLSLGVDDYITKPFNAKELKIRVHNLLVNQQIRKEWSQKQPEPDEVEITTSVVDDPVLLDRIRKYVDENAGNASMGIADLSDHLAMSERQVYRKVATLTGMTPAQLIKELRLKIAHRLLIERKVNKVAELAKRVGFENSSYFSRQFLERYGKRPTEFL